MEHTLSSLITSADSGDRSAADALFSALYAELHRMARRQLARSSKDLTLGTTTLLHEAYLDMSKHESEAYVDRGRFMAYASRVMRGLIIDYLRSRGAQKRGGDVEKVPFDADGAAAATHPYQLEQIGEALDLLAAKQPLLAQLVDLKFFCGFSFPDIALMRGVSERTVLRDWKKARLYLYDLLGRSPG